MSQNLKKSNLLNFIINWTCITNRKQIGTLCMLLGGFAGVVGMGLSMVIRLELSMPGNTFLEGNHHLYNAVVTAHGLFMGLLFFIVSIIFTKYFSKKNFILIIVTRISFIFTFLITFTILLSCGLEFFTRSDNRYAQSLFLIFIFLFATFWPMSFAIKQYDNWLLFWLLLATSLCSLVPSSPNVFSFIFSLFLLSFCLIQLDKIFKELSLKMSKKKFFFILALSTGVLWLIAGFFIGPSASFFLAVIFFYWYWADTGLMFIDRLRSDFAIYNFFFRFFCQLGQCVPQANLAGFAGVLMTFPVVVFADPRTPSVLDVDAAKSRIVSYTYLTTLSWEQANRLLTKKEPIFYFAPVNSHKPSDILCQYYQARKSYFLVPSEAVEHPPKVVLRTLCRTAVLYPEIYIPLYSPSGRSVTPTYPYFTQHQFDVATLSTMGGTKQSNKLASIIAENPRPVVKFTAFSMVLMASYAGHRNYRVTFFSAPHDKTFV